MNILRGLLLAWTAGLLLTTAQAQPTIIQQPANATAAAGVGAVVNFSVHATGVGTLAYQWLKVGTNMTNGAFAGRATVSGAITNTLTLTSVTTNDESVYSCRVTDGSGSVTSNPALLTTIVPPLFTTQPITRITNAGSNVTFTFKPHPALVPNLDAYPRLRCELTMAPLADILGDFDVVVSANSTSAACDALVAGLRVIVTVDGEALNLSPLRGHPAVEFISSAEELRAALQNSARQSSCAAKTTLFHLDPSLPAWRRLRRRTWPTR